MKYFAPLGRGRLFLLLLGRVSSGGGCDILIDKANQVLKDEFPEIAESIEMMTPDETNKGTAKRLLPEVFHK